MVLKEKTVLYLGGGPMKMDQGSILRRKDSVREAQRREFSRRKEEEGHKYQMLQEGHRELGQRIGCY